jgi:hypothetical protein
VCRLSQTCSLASVSRKHDLEVFFSIRRRSPVDLPAPELLMQRLAEADAA